MRRRETTRMAFAGGRVAGVRSAALALALASVALAGCDAEHRASAQNAGVARTAARPHAPRFATWTGRHRVHGVVDLSSPGRGGSIVIAAAGRLLTLTAGARLAPFAPHYSAPPGLEPYIARSSGQRVSAAGCRFPVDAIYALRLNHGDGVSVIGPAGGVRRFARMPNRGLENGIAFDTTGRFGHRLLVTSSVSGKSTLYAIDCRGRVRVLTREAPKVEGGIAVAPVTFGSFAGELIAPDELSGRIYGITPAGRWRLVARSGLPHGQDVGVESEGFVPARFADALVSDRRTRRNRHPGDDLILGLSHASLTAAGVRPGDLLVVSEGGAQTVAVACTTSACTVRHVANGPRIAHVEGHVVFSASPAQSSALP